MSRTTVEPHRDGKRLVTTLIKHGSTLSRVVFDHEVAATRAEFEAMAKRIEEGPRDE